MLITFRSKKVESTKMMVLLCKIYKMVFRKNYREKIAKNNKNPFEISAYYGII